MQRKKENLTLFIILPLILVVCFWVWWTRLDITNEVVVRSETPEWHLHDYDFDEVFVRARGNIAEYVPGALLTPEEFEEADYIVGTPKNSADYLTSRFRLYVPEGRVYALTTSSVDFADKIYINGQFYEEIGHPASTREEMVARTRWQFYTVIPENGVIEIVQQVSNFVHDDGGNPTGFRIGSIETISQHYDRRTSMVALEVGAFLLMTLAYLILYLFQRGYRANLFFALAALVWFFQTFAEGHKLLIHIYPAVTWDTTFRIEYAAVPLTALFMMLGLDELFKGLVHRSVKIAGAAVCIAITLYDLFADTLAMSYAKAYLYNPVYVLWGYLLLRFLWRFIRKDRSTEAIVIVCALLVYGYATVRDHLYRNGTNLFPGVSTTFSDFSLLVFTLFIMVASFYGTMRQVREAMEQRQQLAAENAVLDRLNQMKSELMANLTHELRTPLAVMSAYAQLTVEAVQEGKVDEQTTEDLKLISSESKRLADMASNILGVFRNKEAASGMAPYSLKMVAEQVKRLAAPMLEKNNNTLVLDIPDDLPPAYGRAEECTQLLWNLLTNANAHTVDGVIAVNAEWTNNAEFRIKNVELEGQLITVTVRDTGSGISPELLPHVFERNVSSSDDSAGLGLAICKEIVEAHGGSISVESEEGEGTTVRLTIPAAEREDAI